MSYQRRKVHSFSMTLPGLRPLGIFSKCSVTGTAVVCKSVQVNHMTSSNECLQTIAFVKMSFISNLIKCKRMSFFINYITNKLNNEFIHVVALRIPAKHEPKNSCLSHFV